MLTKTNKLMKFDCDSLQLREVYVEHGQMPGCLIGHQFYTIRTKMFVIGGKNMDVVQPSCRNIWVYHAQINEFEKISDLKYEVNEATLQITADENAVLLIGGKNRAG